MGIFSSLFGKKKSIKPNNILNKNKSKTEMNNEYIEDDEDEEYEPDDEFRVVNTKLNNEDGSSRKEALSKCSLNDKVSIKAVLIKGIPNVEVWTDHGMIGHLSKGPAKYAYPLVVSGDYVDGNIIFMTLGTPEKPRIKCRIKLNRK